MIIIYCTYLNYIHHRLVKTPFIQQYTSLDTLSDKLLTLYFNLFQFVIHVWCCPYSCTCGLCHPRMCSPTNGVQQLVHFGPSVFPAKKCRCSVMFKTKFEMHIPREFPDYWWLFWLLYVPCYGTRLDEKRTKKKNEWKMNNPDFWPLQVCTLK